MKGTPLHSVVSNGIPAKGTMNSKPSKQIEVTLIQISMIPVLTPLAILHKTIVPKIIFNILNVLFKCPGHWLLLWIAGT